MSRVNRNWKRILPLLCAAALMVGGCGNDLGDPAEQNPDPPAGTPDPAPQEQDPVGVWKHETGPFVTYYDDGESTWEGQYFVLYADGTARITYLHLQTDAVLCYDFFYTVIDDVLLFGWNDSYRENIFNESGFLVFDLPDDNTLVLDGGYDEPSVFSRQPAVPPEFDCGTLETVASFTDLAQQPHYDSGLAFDGMDLWFTAENDKTYPVSPDTGALGTPIALSTAPYVHAMQGDNFWSHDDDEIAQRRSMANVMIDTVDTDNDLMAKMDIHALAFDPVESMLWIHGRDTAANKNRFLKVDATGEPDVLVDSIDFPLYSEALTWDGTHLWMLYGEEPQLLVKIDVSTFKAVRSYLIDEPYVYFYGIAAADGNIFMIGRDDDADTGVLLEVKPID